MSEKPVSLLVWGDLACFTRPELKVERVSYPLMTPSAARGVLEAIYWEPQLYYLVREIAVVEHYSNGVNYGKGKWLSFRRNEVQSLLSMTSAKSWMNGRKDVSYIQAGGGGDDATQRNTLALQHVAYLITADLCISSLGQTPKSNWQKFYDRFKARASGGKCFHRPYLGCREFAADFEWCDDPSALTYAAWPEDDLGWMLYDVFDPGERTEGFLWSNGEEELPENCKIKKMKKSRLPYAGKAVQPNPVFFRAQIHDGRMKCHPGEVEMLRSRREEAAS